MILPHTYCDDCYYFFKNKDHPTDGYCMRGTKQTWVGHPADEECFRKKDEEEK